MSADTWKLDTIPVEWSGTVIMTYVYKAQAILSAGLKLEASVSTYL